MILDFEKLFLMALVIFWVIWVGGGSLSESKASGFSELGHSFLKGRVDFETIPDNEVDVVYFKGKKYWPLGIVPAVMTVPVVLVGEGLDLDLHQGYVQFVLVMGLAWLSWYSGRLFGLGAKDATWMMLAFMTASVMLQVILLRRLSMKKLI